LGTRCADHVTPLYPQKLALTSPTGGGRSVGIVRMRTKATEFVCLYYSRHINTQCDNRYVSGKQHCTTEVCKIARNVFIKQSTSTSYSRTHHLAVTEARCKHFMTICDFLAGRSRERNLTTLKPVMISDNCPVPPYSDIAFPLHYVASSQRFVHITYDL